MAWNVPPQIRLADVESPQMAATRASMSSAARRVKVSSSTRSGGVPLSSSAATRLVSVRVLPVPAPASTTRGSVPCRTAASCCSSRPASHPSSYTCSTLAAHRRPVTHRGR